MLTVEKSREIKYPDNVRWGKGSDPETTATLTFKDLKNIFNLDIEYSFTTSQGKITYQKEGLPIGGMISSFYANTICAFHEYNFLSKLTHSSTRICGIRQMDDLLVWIATKKNHKNSMIQAQKIKKKILKRNGVYFGGLELEEEKVKKVWQEGQKYFIHEFAGTEITIRAQDPIMSCTTLNKNKTSILKHKTQTIVRYPPWTSYTTKQSKRGVIIGTLYRTEQQNTSTDLAANSILENYREYRAIGYSKQFYIGTLRRFMKNNKDNEKLTLIATAGILLINAQHKH